jgi:integrase
VVEHYLHTVTEKTTFAKAQRPNGESTPLRPDLCPDPGAKKHRSPARFTRIAIGLYRYGSTGEIYLCRKVAGKNVWRKLQTKERKTAMALAAIFSYAETQNGDHRVEIIDPRPSLTGAIIPKQSTPAPLAAPCPAPPPKNGRSMSIRALIEELKAQSKHLAPSTQKIREAYLNALSRSLDVKSEISSVTPSMIRKVRGALAQGRAASTVNDIMSKALRPLLALAVELELLEKSPLDGMKALKKAKPIRLQPSWDVAQEIVNHIHKSSPESGTISKFMLFFGVGQAEIKGIQGEHIDLEAKCVHFFRQKTRKHYTVPIYAHAGGFIKELEADGKILSGKLVTKWINPRKALETACRRLKLPNYTPRALRRTFIIHCLEKGVDARVVASWQGHADAKLILSTYGNFISPDHAKAQLAKLA